MGDLEHFAPTGWRFVATLIPRKDHVMTDHKPTYRRDDEVTVTIKARVLDDTAGGLIVEWLNVNGFPDRLAVRPCEDMTVVPAEVTDADKARRIAAYRLLHNAGWHEEDREPWRRTAPYGADLTVEAEPSHG